MLAISSRNSVPPSATSKRPRRSVRASVKAPRSWPKSSLSTRVSETPPVLTETKAAAARGDASCRACARSDLPVPFSPVMRTLASDGPTRASTCSTGCMAGERATSGGAPRGRSSAFSASSRRLRRSARPSSTWVRSTASSRALSQGFWMKSPAPRRMASTAMSTVPQAVMTTTGIVVSRRRISASRSRPFAPRRRVARVVQVDEGHVVIAARQRREDRPRRSDTIDLISLELEQQADRFDDVGLIVGHQHTRRGIRGDHGHAFEISSSLSAFAKATARPVRLRQGYGGPSPGTAILDHLRQ